MYSQSNIIAKTYREYTTTKLLTMEFIHNFYRLDRLLDDLTPQQLWEFASTKIEGLPDELPLHLIYLQISRVEHTGSRQW